LQGRKVLFWKVFMKVQNIYSTFNLRRCWLHVVGIFEV
jgi:hypothetical protein